MVKRSQDNPDKPAGRPGAPASQGPLAQVEARETLPSFYYQATSGEMADGALRLPWSDEDPTYGVGFFARDEGGLTAPSASWMPISLDRNWTM